ncbi:unnamed protein product [Darwinula stevensoni]|uniref:Kringle domain-containing protein n=1 Tax=Darwinula stevensoni TaxID=69355 RepID=A0A7R9AFW1_9CRUS|nr:unnamed protein product [Darwinula stevensoni]CAG0903664.1 unnamed protein product [Darwinula stevensoni]
MAVRAAMTLLFLLRPTGSADFVHYYQVQSGQRSGNVKVEYAGITLANCTLTSANQSPGPSNDFNYRESDGLCQLILPGNDVLVPSDGFLSFVLRNGIDATQVTRPLSPSDTVTQSADGEQHAYPECLLTQKGKEYIGTTNVTASGRECLTWADMPYGLSDDSPSIEHWENFLDLNDSSQHNHCRNPNWRERPWCFVPDADILWEYCDIPTCTDLEDTLQVRHRPPVFYRGYSIVPYGQRLETRTEDGRQVGECIPPQFDLPEVGEAREGLPGEVPQGAASDCKAIEAASRGEEGGGVHRGRGGVGDDDPREGDGAGRAFWEL